MAETEYDLLLTFLSEKGAGSWQELKDAWEWIFRRTDDPSGRAWIAARDLQALGHIEVAWNGELKWCAAPPLLTMIPRSGGRVFVTGARTRHFVARLRAEAPVHDVWIDECGTQNGPTSLYLACRSHLDAEALAAALDVDYTYQVAEQIAGLLPPLDAYTRLTDERELPRGLELERFDTGRIEWSQTDQRQQPGLYRCRTYQGHLHALLGPTEQWSRVIKEVGVYEVLRWEQKTVLTYSDDAETLTVPAEAPLPPLHARAATLCSGRLPRYRHDASVTRHQMRSRSTPLTRLSRTRGLPIPRGGPRPGGHGPGRRGTLAYCNLPRSIAERIAQSLSQTLSEGAI
ncbi:MAG TPA: hypothetical protein VKY65_04725 [Alphaproteobacteria bacterium]|nr:hypothetical protein [Alphaproteobacteria bacterium]